MRQAAFLRAALAALRLPEVVVDMGVDPDCRPTFDRFTRRHPRFLLIQSKRYGVALIPVPEAFDRYLAGGPRQAVRTNRRRAATEGFTFQRIDPLERLEEILAINRSADVRQGRPMDDRYLSLETVRASFAGSRRVFGISDREGILRAYLDLVVCGDVAIVGRLLGHADVLDKGVMYLLVSEAIREAVELRHVDGAPRWVMYDTWYGGGAGLRYFKERLGFAPYRVRWRWGR